MGGAEGTDGGGRPIDASGASIGRVTGSQSAASADRGRSSIDRTVVRFVVAVLVCVPTLAPAEGDDLIAASPRRPTDATPVDIIMAVDDSGSMGYEIQLVMNNMNTFAAQLFLADFDYHLVLIDGEICLPLPVGSGLCPDDNNPPTYVHIFDPVGSNDALQKILDNHVGWAPQMRPDALKHLIVVSDDDSSLSAGDFNAQFTALDPSHAGYLFHAFASPEDPLLACVSMTTCCPNFVPLVAALSQEYLDLTALTGGVFGDLCLQDIAPFFDDVAASVIEQRDAIFRDGFETGDTTGWSGSVP